MKRIDYADHKFIVSDRYADGFFDYLAHILDEATPSPRFIRIPCYLPGGNRSTVVRIRLNPYDALFIYDDEAHEQWDDPEGTDDELIYLTAHLL